MNGIVNQEWITILTNQWWAWAILGALAVVGYVIWMDDTKAKDLVRNNQYGWISLGVAAVGFFLFVSTNAVIGLAVGGGLALWTIIVGVSDDGADYLIAQNHKLPFIIVGLLIVGYVLVILPYVSIDQRNQHLGIAAFVVGVFVLLNYKTLVPEKWLGLKAKPAPAVPAPTLEPAKFKTATLGDAKVGDPYTAKVEVEGGSGKGKFEQVGKSPAWTIVNTDGSITGTPGTRSAGSSVLTVRFIDDDTTVAPVTKKFTLNVTK